MPRFPDGHVKAIADQNVDDIIDAAALAALPALIARHEHAKGFVDMPHVAYDAYALALHFAAARADLQEQMTEALNEAERARQS